MKKNNLPEIICYTIFCIGTIIISCFHEPWFDEFQAWGISKDSIYNILFTIPHIEGHPPLWYLILKCFSFNNVNPEIGIRIPNLLFMFAAVWLLIFKSPFHRILKLTLPFTYFIFYQYSVISRPYSIFCFAVFLAAVLYKEKNEHPYKFVSALALLCLSSAYGMALSAGIIIVWLKEIIHFQKISEFIKSFIKDKRFFAILFIFILCLGLVFIMYPDKDVFLYNGLIQQLPFFKRLLFTAFILPADSLFLNLLKDYSLTNIVSYNSLVFFFGCLCGLLINLLFFFIFKLYKKLLFFYIPYLIILTLFFNVYLNNHHIGMLTIFYIFAMWCILSSFDKQPKLKLNYILILFTVIVIVIQIYWSITASINEIKYPYSISREMAEFIKTNNFQDLKIMERWFETVNSKGKNIINFHQQHIATVVNPYFNKNIVYSYNILYPDKQYTIFKNLQEAEFEEIKQKIKEKGLPDIIINQAQLYDIFDWDELKSINYIPVKEFYFYKIWKNNYTEYFNEIYIRSDLYNKLITNKCFLNCENLKSCYMN